MTALCGAGLVASILSSARSSKKESTVSGESEFEVFGLGIWHPDDTLILEHMLEPQFANGMTHHKLAAVNPKKTGSTHLLSLSTLFEDRSLAGTTRVIRVYERHHGRPRLKQRIDWDMPFSEEDFERLLDPVGRIADQLPKGITHIIIKDLGKGVISIDLVKLLLSNYETAKWYVSSKIWRPKWLPSIPPQNIEVLLVPQVAAQLAINDANTDIDCWLTPSGVPSRQAIEYVRNHLNFPHVVILPDNSRVLALDQSRRGYVQTASLPSDQARLTQMASVFLPALLAYHVKDLSDVRFESALHKALAYTEKWRVWDQVRLQLETWKVDHHLSLDADYESSVPDAKWQQFEWGDVIRDWDDAFRDRGIISVGETSEFHLWRGMTELKDYISCIPTKRKHIQQLLRDGRRFIERPRDRKHLAYVITDQPGSGKSFLIDRLAATLGMVALKFNLTQLTGLQDLLSCFDRIRSQQEDHKDVPLLVFFDEVNAKYSGDNYYFGGFLEPMDDGRYVYNGVTHQLLPCLWIFAGTAFPTTPSLSTKAPDFESRLARKPMRLSAESGGESDLHRVEKVYMGVAAIRRVFQDVTQVSEDVLWVFRNLKKEIGPRDVSRIVRNFENVQYSRVSLDQLPEEISQYIQSDTAELDRKRKEPISWVTIVDEPRNWWVPRDASANRLRQAAAVGKSLKKAN